jgi:hypothetical protein
VNINLTNIVQSVAIISACWAIISGIGAWKREFLGKRRIELAEEILSSFFEVKDAIAEIRNPFSRSNEGQSRKKGKNETADESKLLDMAYVVVERYERRKDVFNRFNTLKYRCMAAFGHESEEIFIECNKILSSIFVAAKLLGTHYWKRQGRVKMTEDEFKRHLTEMHKYEAIFWDTMNEDDEIRKRLQKVQRNIEEITKPCFEEPSTLYSMLTTKISKFFHNQKQTQAQSK